MTKATSPTPFLIRCEILSDLWLHHKTDNEFTEFFAYNDLGLPLAHLIAEGAVEAKPIATKFVDETFEMFVACLTIEDEGFENLDEMFTLAEENK